MTYYESVVDLIGNTPLVRLREVAAGIDATVLAKVEYLNPGGSAKDRIALAMVRAAQRAGALRPSGTIVEPTSGNTGVALAMVAQREGYRCVFTCPDKTSPEKVDMLRALGARVVVCPATVPIDHPESYRSTAERLAAEIPGAVQLNQYANQHNARAHYETTGPEVWRQTDGRVTHLVASVGTGGTISGAGRYLKEVSAGRVRVVGADPDGSVYSGGTGRPYLVEGVGQPSYPASFDPTVVDEVRAVTDRDAVAMTLRLARSEGLLVGGSSGLAVAAALRVAEQLGRDDLVVVVLPDSGRGYLTKLFNDEWLDRYGFRVAPDGVATAGDVLAGRCGCDGMPVVAPTASVAQAVRLMSALRTRHLIVATAGPPLRPAEVLGTVSEASLADALSRSAGGDDPVWSHLSPPLALVGAGQSVADVLRRAEPAGGVLVLDGGLVAGVVTPAEVLSHLAGVSGEVTRRASQIGERLTTVPAPAEGPGRARVREVP